MKLMVLRDGRVAIEGRVVGRLMKLELEVDEEIVRSVLGLQSVSSDDVPPMSLDDDSTTTSTTTTTSPVDEVWAHYVTVMQPRQKALDLATRSMIRDALKVATADELKRAVDGCAASTFHMGQNDRGKKYNKPSQIWRGKRGIRTTREQVDLFLDFAESVGVGTTTPSGDQGRFREAKRALLDAWEFPGNETAQHQAQMSAAWLAQHGYEVTHDPETGRPRVSRREDS